VGGKDFYKSQFNRTTEAQRQPGSAFKPIVFAYAVEQGFAQNKLILDAPIAFKRAGKAKSWHPQNFSKTYMGEITLRKALTISQNIPAVRLMEMLGPNSVADFGRSLGIKSDLKPYLSLALGTSEVKLIELTAAYGVFPRGGEWIEPFGIQKVADHRGRTIWSVKPQKRLVMTRTGAAIVTDMLKGVVEEGTGRKARALRGPVAGKTGTTNNFHDALFIGFSPAMVAGVWVGLDQGGSLGNRETGARAALPIWIQFMQSAPLTSSPPYFDFPDSVVKVRINPHTGRRAVDGSKAAVEAIFKIGTEPER
jgi:penicillin-binding protein 1A